MAKQRRAQGGTDASSAALWPQTDDGVDDSSREIDPLLQRVSKLIPNDAPALTRAVSLHSLSRDLASQTGPLPSLCAPPLT